MSVTLYPPQCLTCLHFRSPLDGAPEHTCAAFPDGIPAAIWADDADHRLPYPGDLGMRWEPMDGAAEFPAWVFIVSQCAGCGDGLSDGRVCTCDCAACEMSMENRQEILERVARGGS